MCEVINEEKSLQKYNQQPISENNYQCDTNETKGLFHCVVGVCVK